MMSHEGSTSRKRKTEKELGEAMGWYGAALKIIGKLPFYH
jgi:hypothetical protein